MQSVGLADTLTFTSQPQLEVTCDKAELPETGEPGLEGGGTDGAGG